VSEIWFTADTHLGHSRIIEYCKRPFRDHIEMNAAILDRFNSVIKPGDTLYHLGDVAWSTYPLGEFFGRLNTKQVHLIYGNHDNRKESEYARFVCWQGHYKQVHTERARFRLFHYPMRSWEGKGHGAIHLFGHCHNSLPPHDRSMDVGVDTHNFYPWNLEEILVKFQGVPNFSEGDRENHNRNNL
jgi:calcineurin-like phosphoesterase family protein